MLLVDPVEAWKAKNRGRVPATNSARLRLGEVENRSPAVTHHKAFKNPYLRPLNIIYDIK
jgi:hypothetical protein